MEKRMPVRTCIGCNKKKPKQELIRIVMSTEGCIAADFSGRMEGRGAYLCKDPACLEALLKKKSLNRSFKREVTAEEARSLKEQLSGI